MYKLITIKLTFVNRNAKLHWPRTGITQLTESNSPEVTCQHKQATLLYFLAMYYTKYINN